MQIQTLFLCVKGKMENYALKYEYKLQTDPTRVEQLSKKQISLTNFWLAGLLRVNGAQGAVPSVMGL